MFTLGLLPEGRNIIFLKGRMRNFLLQTIFLKHIRLRKYFPPTSFSCKQFFSHNFSVFFLFVRNITIALLNYYTKNVINSAIATYFVDIRSTHFLTFLGSY